VAAVAKKRRYRTIPKNAERPILDLAERHPHLGQNGLQRAVEELGYHVDRHELKLFLSEHGFGPIIFPSKPPRRGMFDIGWPTWDTRNPVEGMYWPDGEPYQVRFPYWAWMGQQPYWLRLAITIAFISPLLVVLALQVANMVR
jgi:hypothetical protein